MGKFGKLTDSPDGKNFYCKECMRGITKRYKQSIVGRKKQRKCVKKYREKNKEATREYNEKYYLKNRARILYNKLARSTISTLITETPEKTVPSKLNKGRKFCIIKIDPKRTNGR